MALYTHTHQVVNITHNASKLLNVEIHKHQTHPKGWQHLHSGHLADAFIESGLK